MAEDTQPVGRQKAELGYDQGPQVAQVQQVDQQLLCLGIFIALEIVAHLDEQVAHTLVDRQHLREHVAGGRDPALVVAAYGHQSDTGLVHRQRDLDDEIVECLGIDFVKYANIDARREIHQTEQRTDDFGFGSDLGIEAELVDLYPHLVKLVHDLFQLFFRPVALDDVLTGGLAAQGNLRPTVEGEQQHRQHRDHGEQDVPQSIGMQPVANAFFSHESGAWISSPRTPYSQVSPL